MIDPNTILDCAVQAAKAAGQLLKDNFYKQKTIASQSRKTVKLELDQKSEVLIRAMISETFPDHQILGEEQGLDDTSSDYLWIVDPIDGTTNYLHQLPHFCVSIACQYQGKSHAAVIFDPIRDELFTSTVNGPLKLNGEICSLSEESHAPFAMMAMSYQKDPDTLEKALGLYSHLITRIGRIRHTGSTALDLAYVAAGRLDLAAAPGIYLWDIAAAIQMVEAAGGKVAIDPLPEPAHYCRVFVHNGHYHSFEAACLCK